MIRKGAWSQPLLQTMSAVNNFAIIDALMIPDTGNYTMLPSNLDTGIRLFVLP